jgi:hypothetical protein
METGRYYPSLGAKGKVQNFFHVLNIEEILLYHSICFNNLQVNFVRWESNGRLISMKGANQTFPVGTGFLQLISSTDCSEESPAWRFTFKGCSLTGSSLGYCDQDGLDLSILDAVIRQIINGYRFIPVTLKNYGIDQLSNYFTLSSFNDRSYPNSGCRRLNQFNSLLAPRCNPTIEWLQMPST